MGSLRTVRSPHRQKLPVPFPHRQEIPEVDF